MATKMELRNARHAEIMTAACQEIGVTELTAQDVRHCYAVYLTSVVGAPISLVAQSMGNSEWVCNKHYAGFVLTSAGLAHLQALIASKGRAS
jgi:hypothetical protein